MTLVRTRNGTGTRPKLSLQVDLLHRSLTRDPTNCPTAEYAVPPSVKQERGVRRARKVIGTALFAAASAAFATYGIRPLPPHEKPFSTLAAADHSAQQGRSVPGNDSVMRYVIRSLPPPSTTIDSIVAQYVTNEREAQFIAENIPNALAIETIYNIPAEASLAKAIIESRSGRSELTRKANNYFGMKESRTFKEEYPAKIVMPTKERIKGKYVTVREPFTKYDSPFKSFEHFAKVVTRFHAQAFGGKSPQEFLKRLNRTYSTAHDATKATTRVLKEYDLAELLHEVRTVIKERQKYTILGE